MDNVLARAQWPDGGQYDLDLVMHIASKIRIDDEDFQTYSFPVSELGYGDKLDGRTYKRVKDALERLSSGSIKIQGERDNYYFYSLFSMAGYEDGKILVRFDPHLKPFFLHLSRNFTSFELFELRMLPSEYSKRLFLLLKSYSSLDDTVIDLDELHSKLHTPDSQKNDFAQFRLRVLNKAQKDLHDSLLFEWEPIKKGKSVTRIRFIFNKKNVYAKRKEQEEKLKEKETQKQRQAIGKALECSRAQTSLDCKRNQGRAACKLCDRLGLLAEAIQKQKKSV
jgi:Protein involved in initiation of plasmid replication